jgi:hypothetical protein
LTRSSKREVEILVRGGKDFEIHTTTITNNYSSNSKRDVLFRTTYSLDIPWSHYHEASQCNNPNVHNHNVHHNLNLHNTSLSGPSRAPLPLTASPTTPNRAAGYERPGAPAVIQWPSADTRVANPVAEIILLPTRRRRRIRALITLNTLLSILCFYIFPLHALIPRIIPLLSQPLIVLSYHPVLNTQTPPTLNQTSISNAILLRRDIIHTYSRAVPEPETESRAQEGIAPDAAQEAERRVVGGCVPGADERVFGRETWDWDWGCGGWRIVGGYGEEEELLGVGDLNQISNDDKLEDRMRTFAWSKMRSVMRGSSSIVLRFVLAANWIPAN